MALLCEINSSLVQIVIDAFSKAGIANATIGSEWPPTNALENVAQNIGPIVSIWHKMSSYKGIINFQRSEEESPTGITPILSATTLTPGQAITLTLTNHVNADDAVNFQLVGVQFNNAAIAIAAGPDSLSSVASALADQINTVFAAQTIEASVNGPQITIVNNGLDGFYVRSFSGNKVTIKTAIQQATRQMQIITWCSDLPTRDAMQSALEGLLTVAQDQGWSFPLTSGENVNLTLTGVKPGDADTDKDVYRTNFLFTVEHYMDKSEVAYEILSPIVNFATY